MTPRNRDILRRVAGVCFVLALYGALLFLSAGTLHWPRAWLYLGISMALFMANGAVLLAVNPEVIAARARKGAGTKPFDRVFGWVFGAALLVMPVVAGLDAVRWGNPDFGPHAITLGVGLLALGNGAICWSMAVNRHLEQTVRIQEERGHTVVTAGPYTWVRHPMYVGMILQYAGAPLVLGSAWAYLATAAIVVSLVVRTALEDRTLQHDLAGYADYARSTRFRLLPGIW